MRIHNYLKLSLMFFLLTFFVACSGDDGGGDNPAEPESGETPTLKVEPIAPPDKMQNAASNGDPGAAQATAYIQLANTLPNYVSLMQPPEGAGKISTPNIPADEWTWTHDGATLKLVVTESETNYDWVLTIDGSWNGDSYSNQTLMEASSSKDGSNGELYLYSSDGSSEVLSFNWETLSDGTYHLIIESDQSSGGTVSDMYVHDDNSGSLDINSSGGGSWDIDWTSNGSGTWYHYDAQGALINQGSWT